MALFKYNDYRVDAGQNWEEPGGSSPGWKVSKCPYCSSDKVKIIDEFDDPIDSSESRYASAIAVCTMCGWWEQNDHVYWMGNKSVHYTQTITQSILKQFTIETEDEPYVEFARYVGKNQKRLLDIDPAKFEGLVASIFKQALGYSVEFCSYGRPDQGIDIVCGQVADDDMIAIQVKRYKNPLKVSQVREFCGAMIENNFRKGILLTSGAFQSGVPKSAVTIEAKSGLKIDLVDGKKFLEFIGVVNRDKSRVYCPRWGENSPFARDQEAAERGRWIHLYQ